MSKKHRDGSVRPGRPVGSCRKYEGEKISLPDWARRAEEMLNDRNRAGFDFFDTIEIGGNEVKIIWQRRGTVSAGQPHEADACTSENEINSETSV